MGGCVGYCTYRVIDNKGYNLNLSYSLQGEELSVVKNGIPFEYVEISDKKLILYKKDPYNISDDYDEGSELSAYDIDKDSNVLEYFDIELLHEEEMWGVYKDQLYCIKCKDDIITKLF